MFHGSGRYRAPVDSDDSYTSSSGEESLSDSPKRRSPDRYVDDTTESRKVRLVRWALDTAYRSVAVIEAPRKDISQEGQTPWKDLGNALKTITDNGSDARVRAAMDVDTLSLPLMLVIQHDIAPLGNKKEYTRSLSKDEARAIYSVKRRWPNLCPPPAEIQLRSPSTPKWMLLQLFRFSLTPKDVLSFAHLPEDTMEHTETLDLALTCKLLKIPGESVLRLDLTGNRPTSSHIVEVLSAFPFLKELDLSDTAIDWLPLSILKHPLDCLIGSNNYDWPNSGSFPRIRKLPKLAQHPRPPRHRSLIQYTLLALKRSSTLDSSLLELGLSPRIEEILTESYECELCDEICAIRSEDWMKEQRLQWNAPGTGWVGVEGRLCRSCFVFLTEGTASLEISDSSGSDILYSSGSNSDMS